MQEKKVEPLLYRQVGGLRFYSQYNITRYVSFRTVIINILLTYFLKKKDIFNVHFKLIIFKLPRHIIKRANQDIDIFHQKQLNVLFGRPA